MTIKVFKAQNISNMAARRESVLKELSLKIREKQRIAALPRSKGFFCHSDLVAIWEAESCEAVFYELSENQRIQILDNLILFISFLLFIGTHSDWYAHCRNRLFTSPGFTSLKFTDKERPRSEEQLKALGLTDFQAEHWQHQYMFRPAKITLDTELWTQRVDPTHPLPFEQPPNEFRIQPTSLYEISMTHEKDMVSVLVSCCWISKPALIHQSG